MATKEQLIGLDDSKLVNIKDDPRRMSVLMCDRDAAKALPDLFSDAFDKGFELRIASAYRSFYKQFKIFDDKFKGKRPVLDANENPMDLSSLSDEQKVLEIIRFSAIPGFSRHHFGTDFDIYAVNLLPAGKQLELTARVKKLQKKFISALLFFNFKVIIRGIRSPARPDVDIVVTQDPNPHADKGIFLRQITEK